MVNATDGELDSAGTTGGVPTIVDNNNDAPTAPTLSASAELELGEATAGTLIATASGSTDPNGDAVTYELDAASAVNYDIDADTGIITLTQAGADLVNSGGSLPAPVVNATDGELDSAGITGGVPVIVVPPIIARDDTDNLELELQVETTVPIDQENFTLLGVLGGSDGTNSNLGFTVSESNNGTVSIEVKQTALLQVADAISLEIYDNNNQLLYVAANENNPLVGNVLGLEVLGLTNNAGGLTATVSGLEPGDYKIVVRKDESLLTDLVNDLTLAELGQEGVLLGPDNQAAVLNAVEDALGPFGDIIVAALSPILIPLLATPGGLGIDSLITTLGDFLSDAQIDEVLDDLVAPLLSNTLTLLETTDVTATLNEYSFAKDTVVTGNVITPDPLATDETGEDTVNPITTLTMIASNDNSTSVPTATELNGVDALSINGEYGVLIINENGDYTYTANGDYESSGQSDAFTYTISDGTNSVTADLVIDLDFTVDMAGGNDVVNITNNIVQSSLVELDGLDDSANTINLDSALNVSIIGGDGVDTINLIGSGQTLSLSDIFQTEVLDISGTGANTLLVQTADIANSGVSSPIYVKGNSDDTVDLEGDSWSNVAQATSEGETYNVWQSGSDISTQIYIDTDITNII